MPSLQIARNLQPIFWNRLILILLLVSGLSPPQSVFAQLDSLRALLQSDQGFEHDSLEVEARHRYAVALYYASADSFDHAIVQIDRCFELAKKNNLIRRQITSYNLKGLIQRRQGNFDLALSTFDQAILLAQANGLNKRAAQMLDNKANVYIRMSKEDLALDIKLKALDIFKTEADSNSMALTYNGISSLYLQTNQFDKCIDYGHKAISHLSAKDPAQTRAYATGNMALAFKNINEPDSALYYFLECQKLSVANAYLYKNNQAKLAEFYISRDSSEKAIEIFKELINGFDPNSTSFSLQYYRLLLSESYQRTGDYKNARKTLDKIHLEAFERNYGRLLTYYQTVSRINFNEGNYGKAREELSIVNEYKDSIRSAKVKRDIKEIEGKYNVAEKEKIIATQSLSLRNRMISIISLIGVLGIGTLLFLLRQRKLKFAKALADQTSKSQAIEIDNLRKENKIISMQSMLEGQEEERMRIARDLHDNIGSLMTTIKFKVLDIQRKIMGIEKMNIAGELDGMINTASQEIRRISHRMTPVALEIAGLEGAVHDLEQQLMDNNISLNKDIHQLEQITDKNLAINIYRIIQEIVNNAIKHSQATEMTLLVNIENDVLFLTISDNGIGFDSSKIEKSNSIGLSGIESRVAYLNGKINVDNIGRTAYEMEIPLNIED